jgi:type I restriction enzyme, S subunit
MPKVVSQLAHVDPKVDLPAGIAAATEVSFVPMSDVSESGHWIGGQVRKLSDVRNGFSSFADGDILVAKITPCFENGKGAHVVGLKNGIGFGSTEFHVLRARENVWPRFVHHVVQSTRLRIAAEAYMSGSAGQKRVPREFFDAFDVPDVTREEQRHISEILDTLDTTIRQTEAIIEKLKQVKQGLLHDLLTRGIDANGELRQPPRRAPHLYKDSPVGWLPKEWRCETVGRVIQGTPRNGLYKPAGDIGFGALLVGQTAFTHEGSVDFGQARRARVSNAERETFGLNLDDLLVSRVFATREGVGQPVIVPEPVEPAVYESNMMRLRANLQMIEPRLLFLWLKHQTARAWIMSRAFASNQASINRQTICSVPTPTPPIAEQRAILEVCRAHEHRLSDEIAGLEKLRPLKSGLMDDLLAGRVRVTPLLTAASP